MSSRAVPKVGRALGLRIRTFRKHRRLSQERLGGAAGLSGKFIGEVERGEKSISVDSLYRVAKGLGSTLAELVGLPDDGVPNLDTEQVLALVRTLSPRGARRVHAVLRALLA